MENKNIKNGRAPCGGCGKHIYNIPILIDTQESDGNGGFWYQVDENAVCLDCGEPLNYFHVPPPACLNNNASSNTSYSPSNQDGN